MTSASEGRTAAVRAAAVILAAGSSSRLGQPKQLLLHAGVSLLRRAAVAALDAGCDPVIVVLGAHEERVGRELGGLAVQRVVNTDWEAGLASSLRTGVHAVSDAEGTGMLIVMLCDQPHVTADVITDLIAAHRATAQPVVASRYGETLGVPALFARPVWAELSEGTGQAGAKFVIEKDRRRVHVVPFPQGAIDIDTPADLARLHASEHS